MRKLAICFAAILFALSIPAFAQKVDEPAPDIVPEAEANELNIPDAPKPGFELAKDLDGLFAQLKRAREQKRADRISKAIWEKWRDSDSDSINLLTIWAQAATGRKSYGKAMDLLDQVVVLRPDYAEGYNQRATLHFIMKNFSKSIADIERTLALEPRHFGALAGLANILEQLGEKKRAMDTWYRALAVYPTMKSAQAAVLRLEEELAGSDI